MSWSDVPSSQKQLQAKMNKIPRILDFRSVQLRKRKRKKISVFFLFVNVACCYDLCVPNMTIAKAKAKENLGEFICLSITKAKAKLNLQIFICNHFRADGNGYESPPVSVALCKNSWNSRFAISLDKQADDGQNVTDSRLLALSSVDTAFFFFKKKARLDIFIWKSCLKMHRETGGGWRGQAAEAGGPGLQSALQELGNKF